MATQRFLASLKTENTSAQVGETHDVVELFTTSRPCVDKRNISIFVLNTWERVARETNFQSQVQRTRHN